MLGFAFCERCGRPVLVGCQELCRDCELAQLPKPRVRIRAR
jgi:NMD protein affecting ribosome stability and mRNA decay